MPLKIVAARSSKTKSLYIRGSYLGIAVDQSCRTARRSVALRKLKLIEGQIERGEYPPREAKPEVSSDPTFLTAAVKYLEAGRPKRYVAKLIRYFGETLLTDIDQEAIDACALALYPDVSNATRNTCVYTPVSAILRHSKVKLDLKRPKGAKGRQVTDWLVPPDAFGIIGAAEKFDPEYATLLKFLLYTGCRLGAALNLQRTDVRAGDSAAWVRNQKGQMPMDARLRDDLRDALVEHLATHDNERVFRFHQGGHLKHQLLRAKLAYLGIKCPVRRPVKWRPPAYRLTWVNHHSFRHTWATWMRHAGTDILGLVATGNWKDPRSAARYAHATPSVEWSRVDSLPGIKRA